MSDQRYILLLNDVLRDRVLHMREPERRRLREKMEYLANGLWDAGVRVKKLRGTSKVVFEARLNKADRLLFTLGRHRGLVAVYLWGLVAHDDVSSAASRIIPSNAPFLAFQEQESEEREELAIDELPPQLFTHEDLEEQVPEDYGPQRWLVLDDEEWLRLLASPDPSSFESFLFLTREQEDLLKARPPILLSGTAGSGKTTLSVYYLIRGAGAGKKCLFLTYNRLLKQLAQHIYDGLMEKRPQAGAAGQPWRAASAGHAAAHPRFVIFRDLALEMAGAEGFPPEREVGLREFAEIFSGHQDRNKYDAELVWEEIRSIIKGSKLALDPRRCSILVDRVRSGNPSAADSRGLAEYLAGLRALSIRKKIESILERRTAFRDYDAFVSAVTGRQAGLDPVLGPIADIVAKHAADFSRPLLSLDEYLAMGRKRAPGFPHDRAAIYRIAAYYQERLERSGRWDEIDLTRAALRAMEGRPEDSAWDLVVCDEVQDLTDVQISLLFHLAADPRSVVLTGDPRQILNPTAFRWEEVKYRFRERGLTVPDVRRLSLNFRCVGPIVRLANALLDIKQALVGLADTEMREQWKFGGRPPMVLEAVAEEEILRTVKGSGAGQVILTRAKEEAARLRTLLGTELIFTIAEAKGLEFDTVLLWKFCADAGAEAVWRSISCGEKPVDGHTAHVRHELALLYVAVTRARNGLLIWDGARPGPVWDIGEVASVVFRTAEGENLAALWRTVSTPAEWETQGDYFLERGQFKAAGECFRNAGVESKRELAGAFLMEADGNCDEAAFIFERHGEHARAAACHEKAGRWENARALWKRLGEKRRVRLCEAHIAESKAEFGRAAAAWEELGDKDRALAAWQKAGALDKLAEAALGAGNLAKAAELLERARKPRDAAAVWTKAGKLERAGDIYARLGDYRRAAEVYKRCGNEEKLLRVLRQSGDHREIGLLLEKRGDFEKAVEAFSAWAAQSDGNLRKLQAQVPEPKTRRTRLKAAIRLSALGDDAQAAALFEKAGEFGAASLRYERLADAFGLARCHEALGRPLRAAQALDKSDGDPKRRANEIQRLLYSHLSANGARGEEEAGRLHAEAFRMLAKGENVSALARLRLLGDERGVFDACRSLGWHADAIDWFLESRRPELAEEYASSGDIKVPVEYLDGLVRRYLESRGSGYDPQPLLLAMCSLLGPLSRNLPRPEAARTVEKFFRNVFGLMPWFDSVPDTLLEVMLATRAVSAIVHLIHTTTLRRSADKRFVSFLDTLDAAVQAGKDPKLAACQAFARNREKFEDLAGAFPLDEDTVELLGMSAGRYREAADFLMARGRVREAEYFCRIHGDRARIGQWAEKRHDLKEAIRNYHDAGDLENALRAARESGDERAIARALEWLGRFDDAIRIWKTLGRGRDVERVMKKKRKAQTVEGSQMELFE